MSTDTESSCLTLIELFRPSPGACERCSEPIDSVEDLVPQPDHISCEQQLQQWKLDNWGSASDPDFETQWMFNAFGCDVMVVSLATQKMPERVLEALNQRYPDLYAVVSDQ